MIHHGDCVEVMAAMDADSIDAIVTDPPYGLEFMGKEWDRLENMPEPSAFADGRVRAYGWHGGKPIDGMKQQAWHQRWATEALRVAKPGAYLLAFGGTRTVHRLTVALEDAGWIIRDVLVWAYAQGFPKSKSSLKPAWEPIVLARKPGPLAPLDIDGCRLPSKDTYVYPNGPQGNTFTVAGDPDGTRTEPVESNPAGRWPANVVLTDPIFDGGVDGVVGGGSVKGSVPIDRPDGFRRFDGTDYNGGREYTTEAYTSPGYGDTGTYSRFFLVPKSSRSDREPVTKGGKGERANVHPT